MVIDVETSKEALAKLAKEIGEKVADEFMRSVLSKLTGEVIGLRKDMGVLKDSMNKVWASINKLSEKIIQLTEAQRHTDKQLRELAERVNELTEAQKRTEERLNELAKAQAETERRLSELSRIVYSLVGEVGRIRGELVESRVALDLSFFLTKYGFDVFQHFPDVPYVDVVVETDGFLALIEICKKFTMKDLDQVIRGARIFEEKEGIRPSVLVVFSYTGEIDKKILEEAKKRGILIEWSTRRLVRRLLKLAKKNVE